MRLSKISLLTALVSLGSVSLSGCKSAQKPSDVVSPPSPTDYYESSPGLHSQQFEDSEDRFRQPAPVAPRGTVPEPPPVPPAIGVSHVKSVGFMSKMGDRLANPFRSSTKHSSDCAPEPSCVDDESCTTSQSQSDRCLPDSTACADPAMVCADPDLVCAEPTEGCLVNEIPPKKKSICQKIADSFRSGPKLFGRDRYSTWSTVEDGCGSDADTSLGCTTPFPKRFYQGDPEACVTEDGCGCTQFPAFPETPFAANNTPENIPAQSLAASPRPTSPKPVSPRTASPRTALAEPMVDPFLDLEDAPEPPAEATPLFSTEAVEALSEPGQPAQSHQFQHQDLPTWPRLLPQPSGSGQVLVPVPSQPSVIAPRSTSTSPVPVRQISEAEVVLPVIQPRQFP